VLLCALTLIVQSIFLSSFAFFPCIMHDQKHSEISEGEI